MQVWFSLEEEPQPKGQSARRRIRVNLQPSSSQARQESSSLLTKTYHGSCQTDILGPSTHICGYRVYPQVATRARLKSDNPGRKDGKGQLHGQLSRKFSEVAVSILIGLVALGAGKFPCCKPDEGKKVSFGSASSHVLTENYSGNAFRVFALDAIISLYGHVGHLPTRNHYNH